MTAPILAWHGPAPDMVDPGLTPDFREWLKRSPFRDQDFARDELKGGSFGGRVVGSQEVERTPVVFVHGNGDAALGSVGGPFNGWQEVVRTFVAAGYGPESLYGTTWGPADPTRVLSQSHDRSRVGRIRRFVEAVLAYTGHPRVHLVAHSMGVTLARKAVHGGRLVDARGPIDLGPSLQAQLSTFVGIAGANRGLAVARTNPLVRVWNPLDGFYPGLDTSAGVVGLSRFLRDINNRDPEAERVYSIWSRKDAVVDVSLGGIPSGRIPSQQDEVVFDDLDHFQVKDRSGAVLLDLLKDAGRNPA